MIHQSRRSNRCVHNYHGGIILHASMQCHSSLLSLTELFDAIVRTIERRAPTYGFRGYRGRPAASGALRAIRPRLDIMGVHPYPGCTSRRPVKISEASRRVMNVGASRCVFSATKRRNKRWEACRVVSVDHGGQKPPPLKNSSCSTTPLVYSFSLLLQYTESQRVSPTISFRKCCYDGSPSPKS